MTARNYSNTGSDAEVAVLINSAATTVALANFSGFPSHPFIAALDPDTEDEEIVLVTNVAGDTCTITRAYDGTTAKTHSAGATFRHVASAIDFREANDHVNASGDVHGVTGDLVGATSTQTLTNKTLTSPTISTPTVTGLLTGASGDFSGSLAAGSLAADGDLTVGDDATITGDLAAATVAATTATITTVNATDIAVSDDLTVGDDLTVTGTTTTGDAVVTTTLTAATVDATTVIPDEIEFTQLASDPTAAASRTSLYARTDFGLYYTPNGQTRRRVGMHWGTVSTLPSTGAIAGDTCIHSDLANSMMRYNGTNWRQIDGPIQVTNEAALPADADLHAGFAAWSLADDCVFEYDGSAWVRLGELTGTLTLSTGFGAGSDYYTPGYHLANNRVTLRGMIERTGATINVPIGGTVSLASLPAAIRPTSVVSPLSWFIVGIPSTQTYPCRLFVPSPYTTLYVTGMDSGSGSLSQNAGLVNLDGVGWYK